MDDELRKRLLRDELKKRNKGEANIPAKYVPKYPDSAEREYLRLVNRYMAIEKQVLMSHIPELKQILNEGTQFNTDSKRKTYPKKYIEKRIKARIGAIYITLMKLSHLFDNISREIDSAFRLFDLNTEIKKVARLNHRLTISEWKKVVSKTLGIDIRKDYYSGEYYQETLEKWVSDNVDLIKTVPKDSLGKMKEMIYRNYIEGRTTTDIVGEIQHQYGVSKNHAKMIARDQTSKLNADITEYQQRDAGVSHYIWRGIMDSRERPSHRRLQDCVCSWDNPPETDGGRHCHPGQDYQCRCRAKPVFDIDKLDLPV